ncbi:MAG TPA: TetR/AcrR family transcriptional regulator [Rhodocyclaceae bacterium]
MKCPFRCRRKDARPGELISAALEVFVEKGFAAARLDDVAAKAGVSKGTVYLYFESKEALFKAVIEAGAMSAVEALEQVAADGGSSASERLRRFMATCWQTMNETPLGDLLKLLVAESQNFPEIGRWFDTTIVRRVQNATRAIIAAGVAEGEFRPVPADTAADIVFAPFFAHIIWQRAFGAVMIDLPPPERFFADTLDVLVHGLLRVPGTGAQS